MKRETIKKWYHACAKCPAKWFSNKPEHKCRCCPSNMVLKEKIPRIPPWNKRR